MTDTRHALAERDTSKPAEKQGLFDKFKVLRRDGSSEPGEKHDGCEYFVLDIDHDPHAKAALAAYADDVEATHPYLAKDMRARYALSAQPVAGAVAEPVRQADDRGDMAMREWHRECDDADTILRALGLDPVNCRTDGGSLKTGMILGALQARDRMLQRSAPAAPSSCGWTDCKNMPKCECCKVWDSMGI